MLDRSWAPARVGRRADVPDAAPRSHLGDGRSVWLDVAAAEAHRWVVDAEIPAAVPSALAARLGAEEFWERWTRAECVAKLTAVPVVVLLRRHGLDVPLPDGVRLRTERVSGLVVSTARAGRTVARGRR